MQTYLKGDYPSAASEPKKKFIRAVNSVLNQQYPEIELVIVADGCETTKMMYSSIKEWKNDKRIKFAFVDKTESETMHNNGKYYRGVPREVGRALATGDIITYLDADDFALPTHAPILLGHWAQALSQNKDYEFCLNHAWYDNVALSKLYSDRPEFKTIKTEGDEIEIEGLPSTWIVTRPHANILVQNTNLISHRNWLPVRWKDNTSAPEDATFCQTYLGNFGRDKAFSIAKPIYVRCHAYDGQNGNKHFWDW